LVTVKVRKTLHWKIHTVNFTDGKNMLSAIVADRYNEKSHQQTLVASGFCNRQKSLMRVGIQLVFGCELMIYCIVNKGVLFH
jgi:hypothetical protein